MKMLLSSALFILLTVEMFSQVCHESGPQPQAMPPIGIMGGHTHSKGHFMMSYRYHVMNMKGLSSEGESVPSEAVLADYMMAPSNMQMHMHMIGAMYAPSDRLTLGLMTGYRLLSMDMQMKTMDMNMSHMNPMMGEASHSMAVHDMNMKNEGLGDTELQALFRLNKRSDVCVHAISGVVIPTGDIDARDSEGNMLPYPMQNGIGSFAISLGINYSILKPNYLIGAQLKGSAPLYENERGYRRSAFSDLNVWYSRKLFPRVSTSLRLNSRVQDKVIGADTELDLMMSPASNGENEALYYSQLFVGINLRPLDHWRFAAEAGTSLYQWNRGLHLDQSWTVVLGVQYLLHSLHN